MAQVPIDPKRVHDGTKGATRGLGRRMTTGRARLGEYVLTRRYALDMSREQLAAVAGLSVSRISQIERGRASENPPNHSKGWTDLERALGWIRGSCRMVFNGSEPVLIPNGGEPRLALDGHALSNDDRVALIWSVILGVKVTPAQVELCMSNTQLFSLAKPGNELHQDRVADIAEYARDDERIADL